MSILDWAAIHLGDSQQLAVMPVSRLIFEEELKGDSFVLYPPGGCDLGELRPVPNWTAAMNQATGTLVGLSGQRLREHLTVLTKFNLDVLAQNVLLAFPVAIDWDRFLGGDHSGDVALLKRLGQDGEAFLDTLRFDFCRFDLPEALPGRVGSWTGSGPYLGAMLYNLADHESYLIAGEAAPLASIVRGIGLEVSVGMQTIPPGGGEVGNIAKHALRLFRDVLEASSETNRFSRAMTLLEFLASPDSMSRMQDVAKEVAAHTARDASDYVRILERFKQLSGRKLADEQVGYRTLVVHYGRFLEDILPHESDRRSLFRELQQYASCMIDDLINHQAEGWEAIEAFRCDRRISIGVSKASE